MSDINKTWGIKPVLAEFEPSRIILRRFHFGDMQGDPVIYVSIRQHSTGSMIYCKAIRDMNPRIFSVGVLLLGGYFVTTLIRALVYAPRFDLFGFIAFPALGICALFAMRWFVKRQRERYEQALPFYIDFLTTKLKSHHSQSDTADNSRSNVFSI